MTLPSVFSGLSTLTEVNRLILDAHAQVSGAETTPDDTGFILTEEGDLGGRPADPDDEETESGTAFRSFSSVDPFEFQRVKEWIEQQVFAGEASGQAPLINAFVNEWANELSTGENQYPTADAIIANQDFLNGAAWLPFRTAMEGLPGVFSSESRLINEETGEEEVVPTIVINDPLTGVEFIEETIVSQIDLSTPSRYQGAISQVMRQGPRDTSMRVISMLQENPTTPSYIDTFAKMRQRLERLAHVEDDDTPVAVSKGGILPFVSEEELTQRLTPKQTTTRRGGGGGGTRRSLEFDRNHLVSQVEDLWHSWMLEPGEAPMGIISGIVDNYIREAKAFWSGKGGQLDFDTYVKEKLRSQPRYKTVFKHKLPGTGEEEFLNEYLGRISQFGQSDEFNQTQGFAAVTSGAAPLEQVKRVSRTREVQNAGGFSQRLAQTIKGLGVG